MKYLLSLLMSLALYPALTAQTHRFMLGKTEFLLDGHPLQLISGELHPARIPAPYWRHRIRMAKAMGCNTIAAYIFWNYHETSPGVFDFASEGHNIAEFIRICQQEGMWVLLRPGPYVCAEWDFGGIPSYLLKVPDIRLRCMDARYLFAVSRYIHRLAREIKPLQVSHGGPVLMLQIENEYGSYGNDRAYIDSLGRLWRRQGIDIPFYTADGATPFMLEAGSLPGAAIGLDSGTDSADFAQAYRKNPGVPAFSAETYPGWLTHWGEAWARPDTADLLKELGYLMSHQKSFNLYVAHGGTNFGYSAGANAFSPTQYQPDITSYDYDAPINEQGRPTPKFFAIRNLLAHYRSGSLPSLPEPVPAIQIPAMELKPLTTLWNLVPALPHFHSAQPLTLEALGQNQGLVLYRTRLLGHKSGKLTITEPHDYALVFLDGHLIDTVKRDGGKWTVNLPPSDNPDPLLEILVEGMGHINFAQFMIDRKGITERVTLNGMTLMNWEMVPLAMDEKFLTNRVVAAENQWPGKPGIFFNTDFTLDRTGDTFFDLAEGTKGMVSVNGHLLGRYWNIGPQQRLYCPAGWLKKGKNTLLVFDFFRTTPFRVRGQEAMNE